MMMYKLALFFAIFGAVTGAFTTAMTYTDHSWFPGVTDPGANKSGVTSDQITSIQPSENDAGDTTGARGLLQIAYIGYEMVANVLLIEPTLARIMVVPNPSNPSQNLFVMFLWPLQLGIWATYVIGYWQVKNKTSFKWNI